MPENIIHPAALRLFASLRQRQYSRGAAIIQTALENHSPEYIHLNIMLPVIGLLASQLARGLMAPDTGDAAFQFLSEQLLPVRAKICRRPPLGRKLLATTLTGEMQAVGLDVICDWLWRDGWDILRPERNAGETAIVNMVLQNQPDILAFSCTLPRQVAIARRIIRTVRRRGYTHKIWIGGMAINAYPELLQKSLADDTAPDIITFTRQLAKAFHYSTGTPAQLNPSLRPASTDSDPA